MNNNRATIFLLLSSLQCDAHASALSRHESRGKTLAVKESNVKSPSGIIEMVANKSAKEHGTINTVLEQLFDDEMPLNLGQGHTPSAEIKGLIEKHGDDRVVSSALDIMRAADWSDFLDIKNLAQFIAQAKEKSYYEPTSVEAVIERLHQDYEKIAHAFRLCSKCSTPTLAQFKQLLGYDKNVGALSGAMALLTENPRLLDGHVSEELKLYKGWPLLALRTALFYVAAEVDPANFDVMRNRLSGFYQGELEGGKEVKEILSGTILLRNAEFFTPACAYIKNADRSVIFSQSTDTEQNLSMVFTDCSGFVLNIMRKLFPEEEFLKQRRGITTYHLAALYDELANELKGSTDVFYDHTGKVSMLTTTETGALEKLRGQPRRLLALRRVFEPILDGKELRTGDVLIKRDMYGFNDPRAPSKAAGSEGHALVVVEPHETMPTCVELTSFKTLGYGWKKVTMTGSSKCRYRILRFKN